MELLADPTIWLSLLTLTALEIVLGVDNLVFLAILANRLPEHQRALARRLGLGFALVTRLILLSMIAWIVGLTQPVFSAFGQHFSWRDIILIGGGLFLIAKATHEIHGSLEGEEDDAAGSAGAGAFLGVVIQIGIVDIVFSLDSVITAVGMVRELWVMIAAVIISMLVMLVAATPLSNFVSAHPTVKMLALAFLLMIGMALIGEGFEVKVPKGYIYAAMVFSVIVEALNLWAASRRRRKAKAVQLRNRL
jgi:predicted tellurium resistance membrane protein TerC